MRSLGSAAEPRHATAGPTHCQPPCIIGCFNSRGSMAAQDMSLVLARVGMLPVPFEEVEYVCCGMNSKFGHGCARERIRVLRGCYRLGGAACRPECWRDLQLAHW
jgi:hypothetical protein